MIKRAGQSEKTHGKTRSLEFGMIAKRRHRRLSFRVPVVYYSFIWTDPKVDRKREHSSSDHPVRKLRIATDRSCVILHNNIGLVVRHPRRDYMIYKYIYIIYTRIHAYYRHRRVEYNALDVTSFI